MSSELGAESPPTVIIGSSTVVVVLFTVVVVPFTVKFPATVKLSSTVTVPPAESIVRFPVEVSISPSAVTPNCTFPAVAPSTTGLATNPIVTVPLDSATVVSFEVAAKVTEPPKATAVVLEPSPTVIVELDNLLLAILPANIPFSTALLAIVTTPALVIVTSPDREAAVNPVPSPINI